jgi:hypothetical protein
MIWLTWRQFRPQAIAAAAALAAVAIALAVTGPHLASLYASSGLASCHAGCGPQASSFIDQVKGTSSEDIFYGGMAALYAVPALVGLFWGAPLVSREIEAGTFRLAWNQSVPRTRWLTIKLTLIGLAAAASAGVLSLMISWWASPLYDAAAKSGGNALSISKLPPPLFGATGIVPIGYAAFAFALGVTAGVLVRRMLPAMAVTLAVFAAVQLLMPTLVRPHLITPVHATQSLSTVSFDGTGISNNNQLTLYVSSVNGKAGDWILASLPVNAAGQPVTTAPPACASLTTTFVPCLASHGVRMAVSYQPASRYWAFQWIETGIFLVLAAGLGGLCYWRIRRIS